MSFLDIYKNKIITTIIGLAIPAFFVLLGFAAIAYADGRYVGVEAFKVAISAAEARELKMEVRQLDREIFKVQQETLFTDDPKMKRKYEVFEKQYKREKEAIRAEIKLSKTTTKGG